MCQITSSSRIRHLVLQKQKLAIKFRSPSSWSAYRKQFIFNYACQLSLFLVGIKPELLSRGWRTCNTQEKLVYVASALILAKTFKKWVYSMIHSSHKQIQAEWQVERDFLLLFLNNYIIIKRNDKHNVFKEKNILKINQKHYIFLMAITCVVSCEILIT